MNMLLDVLIYFFNLSIIISGALAVLNILHFYVFCICCTKLFSILKCLRFDHMLLVSCRYKVELFLTINSFKRKCKCFPSNNMEFKVSIRV